MDDIILLYLNLYSLTPKVGVEGGELSKVQRTVKQDIEDTRSQRRRSFRSTTNIVVGVI